MMQLSYLMHRIYSWDELLLLAGRSYNTFRKEHVHISPVGYTFLRQGNLGKIIIQHFYDKERSSLKSNL